MAQIDFAFDLHLDTIYKDMYWDKDLMLEDLFTSVVQRLDAQQ